MLKHFRTCEQLLSNDIALAFLEFHFFREYFGQLSQKADVSYSLSPISGGCFYLNTLCMVVALGGGRRVS